jgi:hypothetical protein
MGLTFLGAALALGLVAFLALGAVAFFACSWKNVRTNLCEKKLESRRTL